MNCLGLNLTTFPGLSPVEGMPIRFWAISDETDCEEVADVVAGGFSNAFLFFSTIFSCNFEDSPFQQNLTTSFIKSRFKTPFSLSIVIKYASKEDIPKFRCQCCSNRKNNKIFKISIFPQTCSLLVIWVASAYFCLKTASCWSFCFRSRSISISRLRFCNLFHFLILQFIE